MTEQLQKRTKCRDIVTLVLVAVLAVAGVWKGLTLPPPENSFTPEQLLGMQTVWANLYALVFLIFCLLCAGGIVVLLWVLRPMLNDRLRYQMRTLAVLMADAGIWVVTDSEFLKIAVLRTTVVAFVSLLSFGLLVPLTLEFVSCFLREEQPTLEAVQAAALVVLVVDVLGWVSGVFTMFWLIPLFHFIIVAGVVVALRAIITDYRRSGNQELRDMLWGFALLGVFGVISVVLFYWEYLHNADRVYALFYCVGTLCFLLFLAGAAIRRLKDNFDDWMKLETYKTLAYRDTLTGLSNYTAFRYEKARWNERTDWVCIMMDVNGLKRVNDQHGHSAGDALICGAARCIQEAFFRAVGCYRVGGDEFVVLAHSTDRDAVEAALWNLDRICTDWNRTAEFPVSIAVGYAMQMSRKMTADELFAEADAAMYQRKAEMKKAAAQQAQ